MASLLERYADRITGVLSGYDRIIIQGTLPGLCWAEGMTAYLYAHQIRIFDYPRFAEPFRDAIRQNAERIARENGLEIDFLRKPKSVRKKDRIQEILAQRGTHPGLVHIFLVMEPCSSYQPWHDKKTGKTFLRPDSGKCVHYYFYFIDPDLGLCYLRVPTWCPFRLQFYFNGHNLLAAKLTRQGIAHKLLDNALVEVADFKAAQKLSDDLDVKPLHKILDRYQSNQFSRNVAITPDGTRAVVVGDFDIAVIDLSNNSFVTYPGGGQNVAITTDSRRALVTESANGLLKVIKVQ